MNILMFTNTFTPHVGGVAQSVDRLVSELKKRGCRVVVIAPEFEGTPEHEVGVIRVPAIQHFNGSDFSLSFPVLSVQSLLPDDFVPNVIHTHHPFLLGDTALRYSATIGCPLIFTYHTMYEQYTHYVPVDHPAMKDFVIELSTGFANMCHGIVAPSESIQKILQERDVETSIEVIPTGVDLGRFSSGDGDKWRSRFNIPNDAWVIGHLGRLAPEKNLEFLTRSIGKYLLENTNSHYLVVGSGPSKYSIKEIMQRYGVAERVHFTGALQDQDVVDAYHSMDVFAFASKSETQGMVLAETMAAGLPVVALDAPGAREIVKDKRNGRLLIDESTSTFSKALMWIYTHSDNCKQQLDTEIRKTAKELSLSNCTEKWLSLYTKHIKQSTTTNKYSEDNWENLVRRVESEWQLWANRVNAISEALIPND